MEQSNNRHQIGLKHCKRILCAYDICSTISLMEVVRCALSNQSLLAVNHDFSFLKNE